MGLSVVSNTALIYLPLGPSIILLVVIIFLGIISDVIGVAVTAADEEPFHAMASDRIGGSRQAVWLVRNADQVASFANDVVGDVAGTVSGAVGASIVFALVAFSPDLNEAVLTTVSIGLIAALTVAGKAYGKSFAISNSAQVVFQVAKVMFWVERVCGVSIWQVGKHNRKQERTGVERRERKSRW